MDVVGLIVNIKDLVKEAVSFCRSVASAHEDASRLSAELQALQSNIEALNNFLHANSSALNPLAFNKSSVIVTCSSACEAKVKTLLARLKHAVDSKLRILAWPFRKEEFKEMVGELRNFSHWMHFALSIEGCRLLSYSSDHVARTLSQQVDYFQALRSIVDGQQTSIDRIARMMESEHENRYKESTLDWIANLDYETNYLKALSLRVEGTGDWFLNEIESWSNRSLDTDVIWCEGKVGSGKTVLSAYTVQRLLQNHPGTIVAYFFFNNKERELQTPHAVYSSVLRQFVAQHVTLPDRVRQLYSASSKRPSGLTLRDCDALLDTVLSQPCSKRIILDALDEYDIERHGISLTQIVKCFQKGKNTKIVLTSRNPNAIANTTSLRIEATNDDISTFIRKKLDDHDIVDTYFVQRLVTSIVEQARGMFLLAVFQLHQVLRQPTYGDMEDALGSLPTSLVQTYDETIKRIKDFEPSNARIGLETLMWVARAQTLLTIDELCEALSVRKGRRELDIRFRPSPNKILQCCQGLVTIDTSINSIALAHYSIYEYIHGKHARIFPNSEAQMAEVCLKYLLYAEFKDGPCRDISDPNSTTGKTRTDLEAIEARATKYPFMSYAARKWHIHVSKTGNDPMISSLMHAYLQDIPKIATAWQISRYQGNYRSSYMSYDEVMSHSPLHITSRFGIMNSLETILKEDKDSTQVNARTARLGTTPIIYAASHDHVEVIRMLLKHNADPHIANWYGNALHCAAEAGHSNIIRILILEADMNPNDPGTQLDLDDPSHKLPLTCTFDRDKLEACKTLVRLGARLSSSSPGLPILHEAVAYGATKICEWLVREKKLDINSRDKHDNTALHVAIQCRHADIVDLLTKLAVDDPKDSAKLDTEDRSEYLDS